MTKASMRDTPAPAAPPTSTGLLSGKAIVITGANTGIGADDARLFAREGAALLTRGAAHDYGAQGLRINAIAPGTTDTQMMLNWKRRDPAVEARLNAATPMGRSGQPTEVGEATAWLLSDRASYVNGAVLPIDGGMTA